MALLLAPENAIAAIATRYTAVMKELDNKKTTLFLISLVRELGNTKNLSQLYLKQKLAATLIAMTASRQRGLDPEQNLSSSSH